MWSIFFIPKETDHIDVTIDGNFWHTWHSADGPVKLPLSFNQYNETIKVFAIGQDGKDASLIILWDDKYRHQMNFDGGNGETAEVNKDRISFKV